MTAVSNARGDLHVSPRVRPDTALEMAIEVVPGTTIVVLRGDLDIATGPSLVAALTTIANAETGRVVIDLTDVDYLGAHGIGVFIAARCALRTRGGNLVLRSPSPIVQRILACTGLTSLVEGNEDRVGPGLHDRTGTGSISVRARAEGSRGPLRRPFR